MDRHQHPDSGRRTNEGLLRRCARSPRVGMLRLATRAVRGLQEGRLSSPYFGVSTKVAPAHLAFKARAEDEVREFFRLALDSGGTDNGRPGLRPDYGVAYYAAFVLDPMATTSRPSSAASADTPAASPAD